MEFDSLLKVLDEEKDFAKEHYIPIIRPESSKILYDIVSSYNPNTILEIGTAIGFSGSIMLSATNAHLTTIELKEPLFNKAQDLFFKLGFTDRVTQILGDAKIEIEKLLDAGKLYDFIFLDGPKGQYLYYLPTLTKLLNKGGVIVADNVLFMGMVEGEDYVPHRKRTIVNNLRKYLKIVNEYPYETTLMHIEDGIAITKVKE